MTGVQRVLAAALIGLVMLGGLAWFGAGQMKRYWIFEATGYSQLYTRDQEVILAVNVTVVYWVLPLLAEVKERVLQLLFAAPMNPDGRRSSCQIWRITSDGIENVSVDGPCYRLSAVPDGLLIQKDVILGDEGPFIFQEGRLRSISTEVAEEILREAEGTEAKDPNSTWSVQEYVIPRKEGDFEMPVGEGRKRLRIERRWPPNRKQKFRPDAVRIVVEHKEGETFLLDIVEEWRRVSEEQFRELAELLD